MDNFDEEEISNEEETPEVPEEQINNAQEDLAQEFETELDTVGKQAKLIARKKTIDLLLKKYKIVFLVVAGIAVAAALIILAVVVGSGVPEYEYVEASCSQVTVTYDPYGPEDESTTTMDLEEYVKRAVYAYTTDLEDTDVNFHLYVSLSIALRTEALSNNCQVTYRDKDLQASYTENLNIEDALEYSSGLVIVDQEDNFISSHVSDFCWQESQEDRYNLFQNNLAVPISFTDQYLNNEIYRECPCNNPTGDPFDDEDDDYDVCWITWDTDDDGEDDESEWLHQDDTSGYSVYGALYLLRIHGYSYRGMLEYFFGEDIYIKTTNETNREIQESIIANNSSCMWWPIGSDETEVKNGITMASGTPSTTAITSDFGYRAQPIAGASTYHKAIDIGNGIEGQTNIIAAASGIVTSVNTGCVAGDYSCGGQLGNYVKIQHSDGTVTRYGHMYSVSVNEGERVVQGQVIGKMGNTGNSTGTHLDFQILVNGTAVNPLDYVSTTKPRPTGCTSHVPGYSGSGNQEFIDFIAPYAVEDMKTSNILASVTIAQAILESGWGSSGLARNYNNYFGMKAGSSWTGETVDLPTRECNSNGCYATTATWRVYSSPLESLKDHSRLLANNSRYNGVVGEKNYVTAITIIKNGGYATDPDYVSKIVAIIENNNLTQYDNG